MVPDGMGSQHHIFKETTDSLVELLTGSFKDAGYKRVNMIVEAPKPDAIEAQRPGPAKPSSGVLVPIPSTGPSPFGDDKPGSDANSTANAPVSQGGGIGARPSSHVSDFIRCPRGMLRGGDGKCHPVIR